MRWLARLPRLKHLEVDNTGITDDGLLALKDTPGLKFISLSGTRVTHAGVTKFMALRPRVEVVTPLLPE
jgi:hypothetical protein